MSLGTETDLGPHPTTVIDEALALTTHRTTFPASEVADLLLDIQQALAHWAEESED